MARHVKGAEFLRQLADHIGLVDGYLAVDLEADGQPAIGWVYLAIQDDEWPAFRDRLQAAETPRDVALVILDGRDDATAEDQLLLFLCNGFTEVDIASLFWSERRAALDRISAFRYRAGAAATA
jgi:hypothetical protein